MKVIISPAKKMNVDTDSLAWQSLPMFLEQTDRLLQVLRGMSAQQLQNLWKCNDAIAELNVQRLQTMDLHNRLTPAVLAYEGIQYQYMAPGVFSDGEYDYIQNYLRILSGFYGILRPFDGVTPYRLEMQAKLPVDGHRDLYGFWGSRLAEALAAETDCIVNLASKEYSRCVSAHLPEEFPFLTCVFGEEKGGKIVEKGTMCKMARGEMVRWMAQNSIESPQELRAFDRLRYRFDAGRSDEHTYVFVKQA